MRRIASIFLGVLLASLPAAQPAAQPQRPDRPIVGPRAGVRDPAPVKSGTGRIRGRVVVSDTGMPLPRVQLRLSSAEMREGRVTGTDADGAYEFRDLPAGRYTLSATKGGYVTLQFGQRRATERGRPIELADGQVMERADFFLPRGSVITGRILDEYGEPMSDVSVSVLRYQFIDGQRRLVPAGRFGQTNDIGQYRVYGLPPGDYYVNATFRQQGWMGEQSDAPTGYAPTFYPGTPSIAEAQLVTLGLGQELTDIDLALVAARTAKISGVAASSRGKPLSNANINLVPSRGGTGAPAVSFGRLGARTATDGTFTIPGVPPGDYVLHARTTEQANEDGLEFAAVALTIAGEDVTGLSVVTSTGATAAGQIVADGGQAPSIAPRSVRVQAMSTSDIVFGRGFDSRVENDWTFRVRGLDGARLLRLAGLPSGWSLKSVRLAGADVTDTPIEFKGGESVTGIQMVITNRVSEINGAVSDARGRPVLDYTVVVFASDEARWGVRSRFVQNARPDQDGRFKVRGLPPEEYLAVAVESLQEGDWADPEFLRQISSRGTRLTLNEGETKSIDLRLLAMP